MLRQVPAKDKNATPMPTAALETSASLPEFASRTTEAPAQPPKPWATLARCPRVMTAEKDSAAQRRNASASELETSASPVSTKPNSVLSCLDMCRHALSCRVGIISCHVLSCLFRMMSFFLLFLLSFNFRYIHLSVRPYVRPSIPPKRLGGLRGPQIPSEGPQSGSEGLTDLHGASEEPRGATGGLRGYLDASKGMRRPQDAVKGLSLAEDGGTDERTDRRTDGQKFPPVS